MYEKLGVLSSKFYLKNRMWKNGLKQIELLEFYASKIAKKACFLHVQLLSLIVFLLLA